MTRTDAPRTVRLAAIMTMAVAPVGLLLLLDGLLEMHWLSSPAAHRLAALMDQIRTDYGIEPPALLQGWPGAVQDVLLGLVCVGYGVLGIWLLRGRGWARTAALILGIVVTMAGMAAITADATDWGQFAGYDRTPEAAKLIDRVATLREVLYPGWHSRFEDVVQILQVIVSVVAVVALAWAVFAHSSYFTGKRDADAPPDDWDNALARAKELSRKPREAGS
ncbi:hypothetical protein ODJ79_34210 [Actinoplanes sp. KI2]|uniref:hypothetical protein n=1 Tax=Actinoplanes sp. KI2 TaxID=2983315 RepID=UPI0021D596B4|nr:hypothetical protein [Actinoplanes sp. KI2]MCU7728794.1 hypothetical protein [Actinoplanes sp. KI2]